MEREVAELREMLDQHETAPRVAELERENARLAGQLATQEIRHQGEGINGDCHDGRVTPRMDGRASPRMGGSPGVDIEVHRKVVDEVARQRETISKLEGERAPAAPPLPDLSVSDKVLELARESGEAKGRAEAMMHERDAVKNELERIILKHEREVGEFVGMLATERQTVADLKHELATLQFKCGEISSNASHHSHSPPPAPLASNSDSGFAIMSLQVKLDRAVERKEDAERLLAQAERKLEDVEHQLRDSSAASARLEKKVEDQSVFVAELRSEAARKVKKAGHSVREARVAAEAAIGMAQQASKKAESLSKELLKEREQEKSRVSALPEKASIGCGTDLAKVASTAPVLPPASPSLINEVNPTSLSTLLNESAALKRKLAMSDASKAFTERALSASQIRVKAALTVSKLGSNVNDSRDQGHEVVEGLVREVDELQVSPRACACMAKAKAKRVRGKGRETRLWCDAKRGRRKQATGEKRLDLTASLFTPCASRSYSFG